MSYYYGAYLRNEWVSITNETKPQLILPKNCFVVVKTLQHTNKIFKLISYKEEDNFIYPPYDYWIHYSRLKYFKLLPIPEQPEQKAEPEGLRNLRF